MATAYTDDRQGMTIGRVLARGFGAVGAAPVLFFGVSLVLVALPSLATQGLVRVAMPVAPAPGINPFRAMMPAFFTASLVWLLFYLFVQAMLFCATVAEIDGRPHRVGDYAAAAARALLPLLGLAILLTVAVWIGTLLLIVPGIMLAIMWSVAAPALVVERTGVFGAFGRSRRLTKGARWRIFGLALLVFAIYFVASAVLGLGSLATTGFARPVAPVAPSIVTMIVSVLLQTAFVAIWTAIQAALYVELRDSKDGLAGDRLADIFA